MRSFDEMVQEAAAVPVSGSDYSWLEGRACEERPPWGYARMVGERASRVRRVLDAQTGDGQILAEALRIRPEVVAATDNRPDLLDSARRALAPWRAAVVAAEDGVLPFRDGAFDLVVSRHPRIGSTNWSEVARVLAPGGAYLGQHVGSGSGRELVEAMLGAQEVEDGLAEREADAARAAGLRVRDLRKAGLRAEFGDIGAVVYLLRKIVWFVPDFAVDPYRERLALLDKHIRAEGSFSTLAHRFLIDAHLPR
ncbi:class I SAM-dependent methyltransferase [Actinokineospora globicatena]|uniref:class I SAM-dependent methyltransferase n=1 Tax=Actinokineospora globicatena TaxID=103729 RepID=UPI0020A33571|nr:methyltransferase domain-containing protein [Actinokineospora globicatena]MCP2303746.1 Methyltransferase domain-containing protein [Actinokineospora globicatena]GLW79105.1 methyltransferase type 11 [Actinokineospora globicatena]GLW86485.1 methyltransferase type 11 [Actinokineospora globicatena]